MTEKSEPFDIDAREAQVCNNPRIAPLKPEEFGADARQLMAETRAQFGAVDTSDVPAFFATMFKHPGIYRGQMQLGVEFSKNGVLPPRERELAILRVSWLSLAPFEWGEHVKYGRNVGLTSDEIERVTQGSEADGWSEHDRAIVAAVEDLMRDYAISDPTWAMLVKTWSDAQLMELIGVVGHYLAGAMLHNALRMDLLEGNPGLRKR